MPDSRDELADLKRRVAALEEQLQQRPQPPRASWLGVGTPYVPPARVEAAVGNPWTVYDAMTNRTIAVRVGAPSPLELDPSDVQR